MAELKNKTDTVNHNDLWAFRNMGKFTLSHLFKDKYITYL